MATASSAGLRRTVFRWAAPVDDVTKGHADLKEEISARGFRCVRAHDYKEAAGAAVRS